MVSIGGGDGLVVPLSAGRSPQLPHKRRDYHSKSEISMYTSVRLQNYIVQLINISVSIKF